MNIRAFLAAVALTAAVVLPGVASAQSIAYAAPGTSNVRGGPGTYYPIIARVRGGTEIVVNDCSGSWCAVSIPDGRDGWMAASRLTMAYASAPVYRQRVLVPDYSYDYGYDYPPDYGYFSGPTIGFEFFGGERRHRHHEWNDHGGGDNAEWRPRRGHDEGDMQDNVGRNDCVGRELDCVVR